MPRYDARMLFDLPDTATLYAALLARDTSYDGRAFVGVASTGIFCRLSCPARKPKPENCTFYACAAECMAAGFRPCKRCHPIGWMEDPVVRDLLASLEAAPTRRWRESDLSAAGYDPSTVRRAFKRHLGMTFLDLARQRRLAAGGATLAAGEPVIAAQIDAGFESASAFRAAFARLMGVAPGELSRDAPLRADWIDTPLGPMVAISSVRDLHLLEFTDRKALPSEVAHLRRETKGELGVGRFDPTEQARAELAAYFRGDSARFETPLASGGTAFSRLVWEALREIPAGETRSYSALARAIGRPTSVRAVARANGANRIALMIPCHRVIGADGALTGYGGGLWRKERLLGIERGFGAQRDESGVSRGE